MAPGGRVPKDRSWKAAKVTMAKVDGFLDSLINFNKENIHENCLKAIRPYLQDPEFNPEFVATKSYAAAGLCSWIINIVRFYEVFCDVEPKRQALSKATADLTAAQEKLAAIKAKIAVSDPRAPHPASPPPMQTTLFGHHLTPNVLVFKEKWEHHIFMQKSHFSVEATFYISFSNTV